MAASGNAAVSYAAYHEEVLPRVKQPPELRVVEHRRAVHRASMFRAGMIFLAAIAIIAAIIYNNVVLTELTAEIEQAKTELEMLQSENRRMLVEFESKVSLRNIEEVASDSLGMAKIESYQVEYVDLCGGDRVRVAQKEELGLFDEIRLGIDRILEYLTLS